LKGSQTIVASLNAGKKNVSWDANNSIVHKILAQEEMVRNKSLPLVSSKTESRSILASFFADSSFSFSVFALSLTHVTSLGENK